MVENEDIQDCESLQAWLEQIIAEKGEDEGRRIAVSIAQRSMMRVLPICWLFALNSTIWRISDLTVMPILRACLIAEVSNSWPNEIENAAFASRTNAEAANAAFARVATTVTDAMNAGYAQAASELVTAAAAFDFLESATYAITTIADSNDELSLWTEIKVDAAALLQSRNVPLPLWSVENPLTDVLGEIKSVSMFIPEGPTHWSFWRRWYDDALKGGPPRNPELLKAIALIDAEDWAKGPSFINDVKIPELQAEHARYIASTAAKIIRDDTTGVFTEVAASDLEDGLFRDARERANEAIADFRTFIDRPQSPYGAFAEDLDLIETQIARTADRPIRCYENLADAMLVILDIAKYNGLEADGRVTRLVREFERSRRDLRADDDRIAAREARRIRIGYDELMDAEQADFRAMLTDFAHKSDDTLEAEMVEDEAAIADPETLEGIRDRALLRSSERMVQMDGIEREEAKRTSLEDVGKKADAVNKVAKAGETGFSVIGKIVEWFLT